MKATEHRENWVADVPGTRLDQFVALKVGRYTRGHVQLLIAHGCVTVDGRRRAADHRLKEGERVEVLVSETGWKGEGDFEGWVLHEDQSLIVLNKPAGLLMHPLGTSWLSSPEAALSETEPNLAGWLQKARPQINRNGVERCGIVHRLDRQTSGVLLVAKTKAAQWALVDDFKERRIHKLYRAIVRGVPADRAPRVQAPVGRLAGHRKVMVTPFGKSAETSFKVTASCRGAAVVEAMPLTGRTHQIRAHLALLGHPVMGDLEFDKQQEGRPWPPRLMLHAHRIEFKHPGTRKMVSFCAEPPKDFKDFWTLCRKAKGR
jgi:23S rRNA pseudouridine1911/1915/1917 synthase